MSRAEAPIRHLHAEHALLADGWARDVALTWDDAGMLTDVRRNAAPAGGVERATGPLLPGMPNLHSHAFQRGHAGLAEHRTSANGDSFWTWRALMYRFALALSPDQFEAIATHAYIEMLRAGYTAVCEFHYLHHDPRGHAYADPAEMARRAVAAARRAGIGITLLPVLYQHRGFDGAPARDDQRRFVNTVDQLLAIAARLRSDGTRIGVAPHSLRAVGPAALRELIAGIDALDPAAPIHIHIAEQQQEVDECVAARGARPIEWLFEHAPVDARWCLVHATHASATERAALARSGAVAGLCPTTEANLGDGLFDAAAYDAEHGLWGIGSDSHASIDPAEELRLLEYGQRLALQRRNVLAGHGDVATHLWLRAARGGTQAAGRAIGAIEAGAQADFVVLDIRATLAGLTPAQALAAHVFAPRAGERGVRDVWVGGRRVLHDGEHALARAACERFVAVRGELLATL